MAWAGSKSQRGVNSGTCLESSSLQGARRGGVGVGVGHTQICMPIKVLDEDWDYSSCQRTCLECGSWVPSKALQTKDSNKETLSDCSLPRREREGEGLEIQAEY